MGKTHKNHRIRCKSIMHIDVCLWTKSALTVGPHVWGSEAATVTLPEFSVRIAAPYHQRTIWETMRGGNGFGCAQSKTLLRIHMRITVLHGF